MTITPDGSYSATVRGGEELSRACHQHLEDWQLRSSAQTALSAQAPSGAYRLAAIRPAEADFRPWLWSGTLSPGLRSDGATLPGLLVKMSPGGVGSEHGK